MYIVAGKMISPARDRGAKLISAAAKRRKKRRFFPAARAAGRGA